MVIPPSSSFPLLASDQVDVIRIFHELMHQKTHANHALEERTLDPRDSRYPSELLGLD